MSPGESVLATLIALRAVSVYRWTAPPEPAPAPVRAVYKVLGKPPPEPLDQRAKRTAYVDFRGGLYWAHQLAQWGSPVVLDVLRAAIDVATVVHGNASAGRVVLTSADALPMPSVQALDEPGGP